MPVIRVNLRECPPNAIEGDSAPDLCVAGHIFGIVVVDESISNGAGKDCGRYQA
jgi:hypothetical protein